MHDSNRYFTISLVIFQEFILLLVFFQSPWYNNPKEGLIYRGEQLCLLTHQYSFFT